MATVKEQQQAESIFSLHYFDYSLISLICYYLFSFYEPF